MANRFFGEASAVIDGRTWTARLDFNALIEYEDITGRDALQDFASFEAGDIKARGLRQILQVLLMHHHPEVTLKEAGVILSKDPGLLQRAFAAAMPDAEANAGNAPAANAAA